MAKPEPSRRYEFTVDVDGKTYDCYCDVDGKRKLRQRVHVVGIGSEADTHPYGPNERPIASMKGIAKLIATGIIKKAPGTR